MTDTASLRQAAEMIIATGTDKDWFDTIDAGALRLADAWLAEHPADNDDPATAEWMLTLPGAKRIDAFAVEVAAFGKIGNTLIKGMIDILPKFGEKLADLKVTASIGDEKDMQKLVWNMGYHWQAALYLDLYNG